MRRIHALAVLLVTVALMAPRPAAADERDWLDRLERALEAASTADAGRAWNEAVREIKGFPSPARSYMRAEGHRRAIELVLKWIDELSCERRVSQSKLARLTADAHAAYHRSGGSLGPNFYTFVDRMKQVHALWSVHDRHTTLAPMLAAALRTMLLNAEDPVAWMGRLEARWARSEHPDDQRLWVALLAGGAEPDTAALAAVVDDTGLSPSARAAALEALSQHAPKEAWARARALLDPTPDAWLLTEAALRVFPMQGSAEDAGLLDGLAATGRGWLGVDARAQQARLRGTAAPEEKGAFGIPLGSASVLFLVDGKERMGASLAVTMKEIADSIDGLPDTAQVSVWLADRGIDRLIDPPAQLSAAQRLRIRRVLGKQTPRGEDLPDFFVGLLPLIHEQRESRGSPGIDTIVIVTASTLYRDFELVDRYSRWARQAGLRVHCVCLGMGIGAQEYEQLAAVTGGRIVSRQVGDD